MAQEYDVPQPSRRYEEPREVNGGGLRIRLNRLVSLAVEIQNIQHDIYRGLVRPIAEQELPGAKGMGVVNDCSVTPAEYLVDQLESVLEQALKGLHGINGAI